MAENPGNVNFFDFDPWLPNALHPRLLGFAAGLHAFSYGLAARICIHFYGWWEGGRPPADPEIVFPSAHPFGDKILASAEADTGSPRFQSYYQFHWLPREWGFVKFNACELSYDADRNTWSTGNFSIFLEQNTVGTPTPSSVDPDDPVTWPSIGEVRRVFPPARPAGIGSNTISMRILWPLEGVSAYTGPENPEGEPCLLPALPPRAAFNRLLKRLETVNGPPFLDVSG